MKNLNFFKALFTDQNPSPSRIKILFLLAGIFLAIMLLISLPILEAQMGHPAFDLQAFGYTYERASQMLSKLDSETIQFYWFPQLFFLDILYPLLITLSLSALLKRLYKLNQWNRNWKICLILIIPYTSMFFDYFENVAIALMIGNTQDLSMELVKISSFLTQIKSIFSLLSWLLVFGFTIRWKTLKTRTKGAI